MAKLPRKPNASTPKAIPLKQPLKASSRRKPAGSDRDRTPKAEPLVRTPSSKDARQRISEYVTQVEKERRSYNVMNRGKHIAVLGPIGSLPKAMNVRRTVTITEIAMGKPTFSSVIHHGPYAIMRHSKEVAVLYSPQPTEATRMATFLDRLEEIDALQLAREKAKEMLDEVVNVRRKAEGMANRRIEHLRKTGQPDEAERLQSELGKIIADDTKR